MKFTLTFKTPDVATPLQHYDNSEELERFTEKWLEYGEYIEVEFDTEEGTATVVEK
jgi:hypothetical protein